MSLINIEQKYAVDTETGSIINRQSGEPIPEDEPLMLFRGKDIRVPSMLVAYMAECLDPMHREAVARRMVEILRWQRTHPTRTKEPDTELTDDWETPVYKEEDSR